MKKQVRLRMVYSFKRQAFGIRYDKTVVMLDFRAMEKTDLYTQEDGIIYSEMLYADYRLLYFVAGTKDGNFLYRMYLPEKRAGLHDRPGKRVLARP